MEYQNDSVYIPLMDHRNTKDVQIGKLEIRQFDEHLLGYMMSKGHRFEVVPVLATNQQNEFKILEIKLVPIKAENKNDK